MYFYQRILIILFMILLFLVPICQAEEELFNISQILINQEKILNKSIKKNQQIQNRDLMFEKYINQTEENIKLFNQTICSDSCNSKNPCIEIIDNKKINMNGITFVPLFYNTPTVKQVKIKSPKVQMLYMQHIDTIYFNATLNYSYLYKKYSKYLSKDWQEYLLLRANIEKDLDGYSIIFINGTPLTIEQLIKHSNALTDFIDKHPLFSQNNEIQEILNNEYKFAIESKQ